MRQLIADSFSGIVKQFYLQQAQKHAAGIVDQSAGRRDTNDYRLRYTNVQGRELVTLEVAAHVVEQLQEQPFIPWDWLLIDMTIPAFSYIYEAFGLLYTRAITAARMLVPNEDDESELAGFKPAHGRAFDYGLTDSQFQRSAEELPLLQFAGCDTRDQIGIASNDTGVNQVSSLLVDIRPYFKVPQIAIELYGLIPATQDEIETEEITGKKWEAVLVRSQDNTGGYINSTPTLYHTLGHGAEGAALAAELVAYYPELGIVNSFTNVTTTVLRDNYLPQYVSGDVEPYMLNTTDYSDGLVYGFSAAGSSITLRWDNGLFWDTTDPFYWGTPEDAWAWWPDQPILAQTTPTPFGSYGNGLIYYNVIHHTYTVGSVVSNDPVSTPPVNGPGIYAAIGVTDLTYVFAPLISTELTLVPIPAESTVDIKGSAFRGDPGWKWSVHSVASGEVSFSQWESENLYPGRYALGPLAQGIAIGSDESDNALMDNMQLLGVLTFDQKTGGMSFAPA